MQKFLLLYVSMFLAPISIISFQVKSDSDQDVDKVKDINHHDNDPLKDIKNLMVKVALVPAIIFTLFEWI